MLQLIEVQQFCQEPHLKQKVQWNESAATLFDLHKLEESILSEVYLVDGLRLHHQELDDHTSLGTQTIFHPLHESKLATNKIEAYSKKS